MKNRNWDLWLKAGYIAREKWDVLNEKWGHPFETVFDYRVAIYKELLRQDRNKSEVKV
jgi:hypothetical protein